ncbi:hypothetical protein LXA43DRAFT_1066903 [Ganoderma leucocontextum]|nr:hypothetical protein LXA43DRAFT_1066903 [Ganoderma leucocontextum]
MGPGGEHGSSHVLNWDVKKLDNGNYKLMTHGAVVSAVAGHVFAFLIHEETMGATMEWTLTSDGQNTGSNTYVITRPHHQDGWVVRDDNFALHVILRPIIAGLSLPPTYPLNELFIFKKVDS